MGFNSGFKGLNLQKYLATYGVGLITLALYGAGTAVVLTYFFASSQSECCLLFRTSSMKVGTIAFIVVTAFYCVLEVALVSLPPHKFVLQLCY